MFKCKKIGRRLQEQTLLGLKCLAIKIWYSSVSALALNLFLHNSPLISICYHFLSICEPQIIN